MIIKLNGLFNKTPMHDIQLNTANQYYSKGISFNIGNLII